ncbi:hAT family dimerization domain-containing protein, partial [Klebsiella pneumoniae]|nr:hAT family dimerization domain-containing protein [Klebsiella pneumoniae]
MDTIKKNAEYEIRRTWNAISEIYKCLKKLAIAILSIFSSTYACESLFSEMNFTKGSYRNKLTDESSAACGLLK